MMDLTKLEGTAIVIFMIVTLVLIIIPTLTMGVGGVIKSATDADLGMFVGALVTGFIGVSGIMTFLLLNKCVYKQ